MSSNDVIKRPLITEKAMTVKESLNQYSFEVDTSASKHLIRTTVEKSFKVKVKSVRTLTVLGKQARVGRYQGMKPNWKKAIVTLEKGQKIELFEAK